MTDRFDTAIVIFGAAVRPDGQPSAVLAQRVGAASRLGQFRTRALFIPTGGQGRHGPPEAWVMRDALIRLGVSPDQIVIEDTATDTLSSVRAVRRLIRGLGHTGPVHVATSAYHLPRCLVLCWLAGIMARACPPPREPASRRFWRRWYWRLREVPALPYDALLILTLRLTGRL